jgi:hypothetical protein
MLSQTATGKESIAAANRQVTAGGVEFFQGGAHGAEDAQQSGRQTVQAAVELRFIKP